MVYPIMKAKRSNLFPDVDRGEILPTIRRNFELNSDLVRAKVDVQEIDFYSDLWKSKLQNQIEKVQVILVNKKKLSWY